MCSLRARLVLGVLRGSLRRELSTCCTHQARSRFNLTGNFRHCLQQDENEYEQHDQLSRKRYSRRSTKDREETSSHRRHPTIADEYQYGHENDSQPFGHRDPAYADASQFDQRARLLRQKRKIGNKSEGGLFQNVNTSDHSRSAEGLDFRRKDSQISRESSNETPSHYFDNLSTAGQLRSTEEFRPNEIPVLVEPVKKVWSSNNPNFEGETGKKKNGLPRSKYKIIGGDISESERIAHKKQFPSKKKQTRIMHNLTEISISGEILFGLYPVLLALKACRRSFHQLYVKEEKPGFENPRIQEIQDVASHASIPVNKVPGRLLDELSGERPHQGVCLDASVLHPEELHWSEAESVTDEQTMPCLWLLLNNIVDPMNVGAVLRSSYYFGVNQILTTKNSCRLSPVVSKASSGALEVSPPLLVTQVENFLTNQVSKGWDVLGTCAGNNSVVTLEEGKVCNVADHTLEKPTVLIIGNEGRGLEPNLAKLCSSFLTIYPGHQHSEQIAALNVGVATGIILYTLLGRTMNSRISSLVEEFSK